MSFAITEINGTACPIKGDHVDTDQIIPARYLKAVSFEGIEKGLFYDLRFDKNGDALGYVIDDECYKGHNIYLVQANFGCGSSREHAPQAIKRSGIDAIIGISYSEIFFGNSTSIGLPCFTVTQEVIIELMNRVRTNPTTRFHIDLNTLTLQYADRSYDLGLSPSIQQLFLNGTYDPLNVLLERKEQIIDFEQQLSKYS